MQLKIILLFFLICYFLLPPPSKRSTPPFSTYLGFYFLFFLPNFGWLLFFIFLFFSLFFSGFSPEDSWIFLALFHVGSFWFAFYFICRWCFVYYLLLSFFCLVAGKVTDERSKAELEFYVEKRNKVFGSIVCCWLFSWIKFGFRISCEVKK